MNASVALERASTLCDLGRFGDAVSQLETVLATDPHQEQGLRLLAFAQYGQGDFEQALRTSQAAIAENPDNDSPYRIASLALSYLGRHPESQEMARNAVRLAPNESDCYRVLAEALVWNGDLGEARRAADRAVELAPLNATAHLAVASVAEADARPAEAVAAIRRALAIDPNHAGAQNELARLTLNSRGFGNADGLAQAADGFASALQADPRAAVSRHNLDIALHQFLASTSLGIFFVAFIAGRLRGLTDTAFFRALPALLLLLPVFFAARFVSRLTPRLRGYLAGTIRNPLVAGAVVFDVLAAIGFVVGALYQPLTVTAFVCSALCAVAARLILMLRSRVLSKRSKEIPQ